VIVEAKDGGIFQASGNMKIVGAGQVNLSNKGVISIGSYFNLGDRNNATPPNQAANQLSLNVLSGSTLIARGLNLGRGINDRATVLIDGAGTSVNIGDGWAVLGVTGGQVKATVSGGAVFNSAEAIKVGKATAADGSHTQFIVKDSGSTVNTKDIYAEGDISIGSGTKVNATNALTFKDAGSTVTVENNDGQQSLNTPKVVFSSPGTLVFNTNGPSESLFNSTIEGKGTIKKTGDGVTRLTGDSSKFSGELNINQGEIVLDEDFGDSFSSANVGSGGVLSGVGNILGALSVSDGGEYKGSGDIFGDVKISDKGVFAGTGHIFSDLNVGTGSTLSPGAKALGTVKVTGNASFNDSSVYSVSLDASGKSDLVEVSADTSRTNTGKTVIGSNVNVLVFTIDPIVDYRKPQSYTILKSENGIVGNFSKVVLQNGFLSANVDRQNTYINLGLTLNPNAFQTAAKTKNQSAVAGALYGLSSSSENLGLFNKVLALGTDFNAARSAFDALSGEFYASAKTALIENEFSLGQAVNQQLLGEFNKDGELRPTKSVWIRPYSDNTRFGAGGGTSALTNSTDGVLAGVDFPVFNDARVGVMAGAGHSKSDAKSLLTKNSSDDYSFGVYGSKDIGKISLRGGVIYGKHDVDTKRDVEFSGFSDKVSSKYTVDTIQTFVEADYKISLGVATLKPFVNLSRIDMDTSGFKEKGGAEAITGKRDSVAVNTSTAGVRTSLPFKIKNTNGSIYASVGWQHVLGDVSPDATMSIGGSPSFKVSGAKLSRDAAMIGVGANIKLLKDVSLGIGYSGNFGSEAQSNGVDATLKIVF
jgi:outer membrane autotransporter protein